jgi:predicted nuclease with TOPRIM domain
MKLILTEKQLHQLKAFLFLKEQKSKKDTAIKGIESIGSKKEDKKEEKEEVKKPIIERNKIKITSVKDLEKVLQVVANSNKGLKVPTRVKSKFEKEVKFSSDIISDLKNKLEKLIKTTSAVDHNTIPEGKKDVFKIIKST